MKYSKAIALLVCCAPITALAGPDWVERGDAGSGLNTAQLVTGVGAPRSISGSLSSSILSNDYEDLYVITVQHPTSFSFKMRNSGFDSQLYLFAISEGVDLFGMLSNDDATPITTNAEIAQSFATDGTGSHVIYPGLYCLAITTSGRYPVSKTGAIFYQDTRTEISGPDGPGRYNALEGWDGQGGFGSYDIDLEGIGYADIPTPGAISVFAAGCLASLRRRR